jgi:hypothetical protein
MCSGAEKLPADDSTAAFPPPASGKLAAATAVEPGRVRLVASVCPILPDLALPPLSICVTPYGL